MPTARGEYLRPGWFYDHVGTRAASLDVFAEPGVTMVERRFAGDVARRAAQMPGTARVTWPDVHAPGGWAVPELRGGPTRAQFSLVLADDRQGDLRATACAMTKVIEEADARQIDLGVTIVHQRGRIALEKEPIDVHQDAVDLFESIGQDDRVVRVNVVYATNRQTPARTVADVLTVSVCLDGPRELEAFLEDWIPFMDSRGIPRESFDVFTECRPAHT
ncbi:hypothetical protein [Oerskovia paurometabola]